MLDLFPEETGFLGDVDPECVAILDVEPSPPTVPPPLPRQRRNQHNKCNGIPRVVIEYEFAAYAAPESGEDWDVAYRITHACGVAVSGDCLADVRESLEQRGFVQHGVCQTRSQNFGRYCPTWREVWVKSEDYNETVSQGTD